MKNSLITKTVAIAALGLSALFSLSAGVQADDQKVTHDWSDAELALIKTNFPGQGDMALNKVNLALIYSLTGRVEEARTLYAEILKGRDNGFAMTLSGKPRQIKYIARDGLKRLGS